MKKLLFALVVAAGVTASEARADYFGTPPGPAPAPAAGSGSAGHYGWNPVLKKILWWKKSDDCSTGNCGPRAGCAGGNCAPGGPPGITGGTLVFPTHPFARSPRDYFMYGHGGS